MKGTWQGSGTWQTTSGGGGLVLALIAAAVLIGSGAASAAVSAVVTVLVVLGSVLGLAVLACIGLVVHRARQDRPRQPVAAPAAYQLPPEVRPHLEAPQPLAIEPPRNELHLHFHDMSPADVAEAIRQASEGR